MEYSATNRNKLFINATTWMDLKIITLTERSQAKKIKNEYMVYYSNFIKFLKT